nr:IS66 family insertion sequence element accessory protein TnpB [uncultured Marinifilum sp.]
MSWDKDGFCIYYKRLEKGTFKRPTTRIDKAGHPEGSLATKDLSEQLRINN